MRDLFARLVMHDGRPLARTEGAAHPDTTHTQEQHVTFEYRDGDGDAFTARPTIGTPKPAVLLHITPSSSAHVPLDRVEEVVAGIRDAARQAAGQTPTTEPGVVAHRSRYAPELLLCREHYQGWPGFTPLTSEDLPDGGICTWGRSRPNECGRDVLAEPEPAVEQPAEAQPADQARAYDNLYAELTRGVSHAQVRHHLITEYRAEVLREAADEAERENADCPITAADRPCPPCGARTAVAARLRRMAVEETR